MSQSESIEQQRYRMLVEPEHNVETTGEDVKDVKDEPPPKKLNRWRQCTVRSKHLRLVDEKIDKATEYPVYITREEFGEYFTWSPSVEILEDINNHLKMYASSRVNSVNARGSQDRAHLMYLAEYDVEEVFKTDNLGSRWVATGEWRLRIELLDYDHLMTDVKFYGIINQRKTRFDFEKVSSKEQAKTSPDN